jgi:inhibitor of the pro-sigma K processing machinery
MYLFLWYKHKDNFIKLIKPDFSVILSNGGSLVTGADLSIILAYTAGIMLIFMTSWIFFKPLKFIGKVILNSVIGALVLIIFNYFGQYTGIYIGVNEVTALIIGILGVPGFIAILLAKLLI